MRHELKCWPTNFTDIAIGLKTCEIRYDDRGYSVDDELVLNEYSPTEQGFTGRGMVVRVTHITRPEPYNAIEGALAPGWCVLSIVLVQGIRP